MALVVNEDEISGAVSADVLPAIFIEIGDLKVCAVVRTAGSSIMHQKVFKKIYDQSNNGETYTDIKHIELDFTIDGHPITMAFTVLKDLYVDTILGCDFLSRFKVTLHFGLGLMKWKDQNEVIITEFVKTQEMFRAISGGSSACEHQSKASIEQVGISAILKNFTGSVFIYYLTIFCSNIASRCAIVCVNISCNHSVGIYCQR